MIELWAVGAICLGLLVAVVLVSIVLYVLYHRERRDSAPASIAMPLVQPQLEPQSEPGPGPGHVWVPRMGVCGPDVTD